MLLVLAGGKLMSKYYDVGKKLNKLIDSSLSNANIKGAFVTGGGFAYRSTKYSKDKEVGDFDFMIVFDGFEEISKINNVLQSIGFDCKNLHNVDDQEKYQNGMIDIIRLSGFFGGYKTTINLVPLSLVKTICDMSETRLIKKVAHGRNTGFFYAYGSSGVRQTVCMLCERVVDDEIIFLHLDTTPFIHNKHLYLGILSDAILKGHEKHYDSIEFGKYRKMFIAKIKGYFLENNINSPKNTAFNTTLPPSSVRGTLEDGLCGSNFHPIVRASKPSGIFIKKIHDQWPTERIAPPMAGPEAAVTATITALAAITLPKRLEGKIKRNRAVLILMVQAPPIPCSTREATIISNDVLMAHNAEAVTNTLTPKRNTRR